MEVWKLFQKVKKQCFHDLKRASTTTKTKVVMVRAKLKTIGTADVNATAALQ